MELGTIEYLLTFLKHSLPELMEFPDDQIIKGVSVETEHQDIARGDLLTFAKIALAHLREDPEYYTKLEKMEKTNAKQKPSVFYARHMEPGICRYENEDVYISLDTLKKMNSTFAGQPVYVKHQKVELETIQEDADGYVAESFYNEVDAWNWLKFICVSDAGFEVIEKGYSVSNAYTAANFGPRGDYHNIPYDREILDGEYTHLALVDNPRYENAVIMTPAEFKKYNEKKKEELVNMLNSKDKKQNGGYKLMGFFTGKEKKVEASEEILNAVATVDGEDVTVKGMIDFCTNAKKNACDEDKEKAMMSNEVEVDGETMSVKNLINAYKKLKNKKNADDKEEENKKNAADEEEKKKKEEEEKANAEEEEKKKKEEEDKTNAKKALELKNAKVAMDLKKKAENSKDDQPVVKHEMMDEKVQRGKDNY